MESVNYEYFDSETVLQWGKRKNIKKLMINGELVIE